jgi:spore maturation protein CgeB
MNIGCYIHWPKGSLNSKGNVLGDELIGESMCSALRRMKGVGSCELYAPNNLPECCLDVMIYLNDTPPNDVWAKKHLLYMQNAYGDGSDRALSRLQQRRYDGYAFISNKLLELHRRDGYSGIFLPFGVDTDLFSPHQVDLRYECDVCYVGSDIKGRERSEKYLWPAAGYNFALYGNWRLQYRFQFWKNLMYQKEFAGLSRGKIPQEDVPLLYSSAKITLNCTAQDCVDWDVITLRSFEVLACKGFLITDRVPVAERELNDCVVFTDGGEDLREKIAYYLERPKERQRIATNGFEYVLRNATITSRMETLMTYLKEL